jgi:uncharacterized protein YdeI (YjbR/CyaY-like superfamily)
MSSPSKVRFFRSSSEFRTWLDKNHGNAPELWLGFYRTRSGKGGITYREALDQALCFGWIDGIRKGLDDISYTTRFTPRRPLQANRHMVGHECQEARDSIEASRNSHR